MTYHDVSVIVGGALAAEFSYDEDENETMAKFIEKNKTDLLYLSEPAEIFQLTHEHDQGMEECVCVQYVTDHRPIWRNVASRRETFGDKWYDQPEYANEEE